MDSKGFDEKTSPSKHDTETGDLIAAIDPVAEKKLLRKLDLNIITLFGALYLMSFLGTDRSNIGNANLTGFSTDLGLVNNEYGAAVSVVYATYVVFEPFWTVLLKIITPKYLMTCSTLCWSALTIGTAFVKTFNQLIAVRILLGATEAAIIPCILMYITMTYNRDEYAVRNTYIFAASALSGAFGGLLAYGLTQINAAGMHGWQWMYIVEGIISFCLAPVVFFWLPNSAAEAKWLTEDERRLVALRIELNKTQYDPEEQFSWSEIWRCLKDWKLYVQSVSHFGIDTTLYCVTTFMPTIIAGLGFTSKINSQLLTVPVYFVAAVSYMIMGYFSDRLKVRSPFLLAALTSCLIGYIILAASPVVGVRFWGVFMVAIGLYVSTSLNIVWAATNHAGYFKRAFATGFVQLVGNSAGAAIGFIFTVQSAPRYLEGFYFAIGMTCMSLILTAGLSFYLRKANTKRRARIAAGAPDRPELKDKNPHFLYYP
ncbi:MFS general substrate transporter [Rhizodiscina lignyota]|uniref:MFS general substrate transporter n=1 Tax=Rhizodiscina lignyota TaxID=1504668 RepID=A0A9P4M796_9PEZI|nr:MFS general substrate transporter [Rhizodiscina lignyota]